MIACIFDAPADASVPVSAAATTTDKAAELSVAGGGVAGFPK